MLNNLMWIVLIPSIIISNAKLYILKVHKDANLKNYLIETTTNTSNSFKGGPLCMEDNVVYIGQDINDTGKRVSNEQECHKYCEEVSDCEVWVYYKERTTCQLKIFHDNLLKQNNNAYASGLNDCSKGLNNLSRNEIQTQNDYQLPGIPGLPPGIRGLPARLCESGWELFEGHCYKVFLSRVNKQATAKTICKVNEATLVNIETEDEYRFVTRLLDKTYRGDGTDIWIGAKRNNIGSPFIWGNGKEVTFTDWNIPKGQPRNDYHGSIALCTSIFRNQFPTWKWYSTNCDGRDPDNAILCENAGSGSGEDSSGSGSGSIEDFSGSVCDDFGTPPDEGCKCNSKFKEICFSPKICISGACRNDI